MLPDDDESIHSDFQISLVISHMKLLQSLDQAERLGLRVKLEFGERLPKKNAFFVLFLVYANLLFAKPAFVIVKNSDHHKISLNKTCQNGIHDN